jgi:hypothetical protein
MTERQKKHILLDVITDGLVYSPIIEWDEYGEPYIGNEERKDKVFSSLNELAIVLRQLADDLER